MNHRDDWPNGIPEGGLESAGGLDPEARLRAERIAQDARNMDAVLSVISQQLSERLPAAVDGQHPPLRHRPAWKKWALGPVAAAAAVAALILVRGEGTDRSGTPGASAGAPPTANMMAEMDVEADKPFVVFPTGDPDIAVVWLLNPKESD